MCAASSAVRAWRWVFPALLGFLAALGVCWALRCSAALRCSPEPGCDEPTTLVLVRHADRDGSNDALTAAGSERARALVHAVEKLGLSSIFHSDTVRARDTAAPLARALGLIANERPAADVAGLVREIFGQHRGERVLVVGHSNTLPQLVVAAGGPQLPDIAHDEFDDLLVLDTGRCGEARLSRLQYGAPSP